jgi:hypothetical protein
MNMTRRTFCTSIALGMAGTGSSAPSDRAEHNARTDHAVPTAPSRSAIPRVDVHAHIAGNPEVIGHYLALRRFMLETHNVDLAMWIDLASSSNPTPDPQQNLAAAEGRVLTCIADYSPHTGLKQPPEQLGQRLQEGYIGYKIWAGPHARRLKEGQPGYRYVDDPAHVATFAEMERLGMLAASIHIADPNGPFGNRTRWLPDPVEYWRQINAWRNVLVRHPNLHAVAAHGSWLVCQDAQLDYLRNLLATFPRLSIDLAATFQYFSLLDHANLRAFMIEWADRIVFGTDIGRLPDGAAARRSVAQYHRCFQILETDERVEGGFFGGEPTRGLALPTDVLEKIYYQNAARIYPRVKEQLKQLGYSVTV